MSNEKSREQIILESQGRHVSFPTNPKLGDKFTKWGYDAKQSTYRDITYTLTFAAGRIMWLADEEE